MSATQNTPKGDISFMDTEPMDFGEDEQHVEESDAGSTDVEEEIEGHSSTGSVLSGVSESEEEEFHESQYVPPPPIDITMADPYAVKDVYSKLIETCVGALNSESFDCDSPEEEDFDRVLRDNIHQGESLFPQLQTTISQTFNESFSGGANSTAASVSELQYAVKHNKMCVTMLSRKMQRSRASVGFKADSFIQALKATTRDTSGGYAVLAMVRMLAVTADDVSYPVLPFSSIAANVDLTNIKPAEETEIKPKPKVVKKKDTEKPGDVTRYEILNDSKTKRNEESEKNETPEGLALEMKSIVKRKFKTEKRKPNVLEVATSVESVSSMVSNLFSVAFMVRDGHVGLGTTDNKDCLDPTTKGSLVLHPEKPPEKDDSGAGKQGVDRHQYIASYSAKFLRELVNKAKLDAGKNGK